MMRRLIGPTILLVLIFGLSLLSPAAVEGFAGMLPAVTALLGLALLIIVTVAILVALSLITT